MNGPPSRAMPYGSGELRKIDGVARQRVLQESRIFHQRGGMRRERPALLHPDLERIQRPQGGIDAERERGALRAGDGIGEDAQPALETLDGVEKESGRIRHAGGQLGDGADLEAGIGALDAPQGVQLVDKRDEFPQIPVHLISGRAACGGTLLTAILRYPPFLHKD